MESKIRKMQKTSLCKDILSTFMKFHGPWSILEDEISFFTPKILHMGGYICDA